MSESSKNVEYTKFITRYTVDGKLHGSEIYAINMEAALHHLEEKRKTEHIVGHVPNEVYVPVI